MDHVERDDAVPSDGCGDNPAAVNDRPAGIAFARWRFNRRHLLAGAAASAAAGAALPRAFVEDAPAASAPAHAAMLDMQMASPVAGSPAAATPVATAVAQTPAGLEFFSPWEASVVQAATARLIPTDENGPGATEAGVVYFIDRQLNSPWGFSARRYNQGPYESGQPTQGDQSALNLRDRYRLGLLALDAYAQQVYKTGFVQLTPDQQDSILTDLSSGKPDPFSATTISAEPFAGPATAPIDPAAQSGIGAQPFFQMLLSHTIAGFFSDPVHGGNRDLVGWKLIGFPGAHMDYANYILNYDTPYTGPYITLAQDQMRITGGA
jgi:gluconate 2-dehydrogenase gamma chain